MAWHGLWAIASLCQRDELTEKMLAASACDDIVFAIHQHGLSQRDAMVRGCYITKYIILYKKYVLLNILYITNILYIIIYINI